MKILLSMFAIACLSLSNASAHSGRTDSSGCHNDRSTGGYHCHGGSRTPTPRYTPPAPDKGLVMDVQKHLNTLGYDVGVADGLMGKKSTRGIKKFQQENGLPVDGSPTNMLLLKLKDAAKNVKRYDSPEKVVSTSFSQSIVKSMSFKNGKLVIVLKDPDKSSKYFTTGDKINKIFAIEPARFFYKIPSLDVVDMTIVLPSKKYKLVITRAQLESYYNIKMANIREYWDEEGAFKNLLKVGDKWRNQFIRKYDSKSQRAKFVRKFVKSS